MVHLLATTGRHVLARELDAVRYFLHGEVPDSAQRPPTARTALDLLFTRRADDVAGVALVDDGREGIVETHRAFEEHGQIGLGRSSDHDLVEDTTWSSHSW